MMIKIELLCLFKVIELRFKEKLKYFLKLKYTRFDIFYSFN